MDITQLSPTLSVGAQIGPEDLSDLADAGFTDIVCNRPDAEHAPDAGSSVMSERAVALGLAFHYLPITHSEPFVTQAQRIGELLARPGARVFAYCRSGARSANAWALAEAMRREGDHTAS